MAPVFCADCGTGCAVLYGREVDPQERDIADVQVWSCPVCPCSWAIDGAPAGPETRNARAVLTERMVMPLIREAGDDPGVQRLAIERLTAFLAQRMRIEREACEVALFDIVQCRAAWAALRGVTYAEVRIWAQRHREAKPLQPVSEGAAA